MTWTPLDIVIVALFAGQLVLWTVVAAALLKIKRGPVTKLQSRLPDLTEKSKRLVEQGTQVALAAKEHVEAIGEHSRGLRTLAHWGEPPPGMWVHPKTITQLYSLSQTARTLLKDRRLTTRKPARIPLGERLGLVPPIVRRITPLWRGARTGLQVWQKSRKP